MAITGSPDIFVSEQDLSTFIGTFDVTTAALVGDFEWGPVNQISHVSNEARLKTYFGLPNDRNYKDWYTAKNYLEYSNSLNLVRVSLPSARNAFFRPKKAIIPQYNDVLDEYYVNSSIASQTREVLDEAKNVVGECQIRNPYATINDEEFTFVTVESTNTVYDREGNNVGTFTKSSAGKIDTVTITYELSISTRNNSVFYKDLDVGIIDENANKFTPNVKGAFLSTKTYTTDELSTIMTYESFTQKVTYNIDANNSVKITNNIFGTYYPSQTIFTINNREFRIEGTKIYEKTGSTSIGTFTESNADNVMGTCAFKAEYIASTYSGGVITNNVDYTQRVYTIATRLTDEYLTYTPLSYTSNDNYYDLYNDAKENKKSSTITNFPNYVAYYNNYGQYSVERTSSATAKKLNATPNNLVDLRCGDYVEDRWINNQYTETLKNMKLCTVYACVATVTISGNNYIITDKKGNIQVYYFRKKFEDKMYKISDTVCAQPIQYGTTSSDALVGYNIEFLNDYLNNESLYDSRTVDNNNNEISSETPLIHSRVKELFGNIIYYYNSNTLSTAHTDDYPEFDNINFLIISRELDLNVKNKKDYLVQEQSIGEKNVPILAKYPGAFGNNIRVAVINKPAYLKYQEAVGGLTRNNLDSLDNVTKNSAISIIGQKNLDDDAVAVKVSLIDPATGKETVKEYGIFSFTKGSTDITGYDNYVFNFFSQQSNYVYFNREAFENLFAYKLGNNPADFTKAYINIDTMLTNGIDYDIKKISGNTAYYSDVTTTNSNGLDYDITSISTPMVDRANIDMKKTPLLCIPGGVSAYYEGWDLFKAEENEDLAIDILLQGGGTPEIGQHIIDIAESRKDCIACVSPSISECVNVTDPAYRIAEGTGSYYSASSYAYMDGNYKYQYDSYNDCYRWMPLNGDMGGICAFIDAAENPWMSIGGRQIRNCIKLAFYPSKADRDILFEANVNPVTNFSNEGNVIWGDWTRVSNTAFNFLGVRRCFLYIEKNIKKFARSIMFKQNDQITRDAFVLAVEPFLDGIVGGRGIQEYGVFAGSDVTTKEEMDKGIFRAKFAIKPVRSIRYVDLVFVAIRSDMSISEVIE